MTTQALITSPRNLLDSFFSEDFFPVRQFLSREESGLAFLKTDIREEDDKYLLDFEIPGVKKEDVKININDKVLNVEVKFHSDKEQKEENYLRRERSRGIAKRSFTLDENVDEEKTEAELSHGVLHLKLFKAKPKKHKQLEIKIK